MTSLPPTASSTQTQLAGQIGAAVASKVLDAQRQAGANVLKLLDSSLQASRASTASEDGRGKNLDTTA